MRREHAVRDAVEPAGRRAGLLVAGAAVSFGLAIIGMGVLVGLTLLIVRAEVPLVLVRVSANDEINRLFTYQVAGLLMTVLVAAVTARLIPENFSRYFRVGRMAAPVGAVRALGISGTETWKTLGTTFSVIISLVTAAIVLLPEVRGAGLTLSPYVTGVAVVLAASNAFVEEYLTRFQVVASLTGRVAPGQIAVISALLFGIPHYVGTPGQLIGVLVPPSSAGSWPSPSWRPRALRTKSPHWRVRPGRQLPAGSSLGSGP